MALALLAGRANNARMTTRPQLNAVPSTLLIPLAARAHGDRYFPWLACHDAVARGLLDGLGADPGAWLDDQFTVLNVLWRTRVIRDAGRAFFTAYPGAQGVNLGCGLSHHFQWLDTGRNRWLDADLPEVMALRNALLPPANERVRHACADLIRPGWWHRLGLPGVRDAGGAATPVFVLCEGVLMYLEPAQVRAVLAEFARCAPPGSRMLLDVITHRAVGRADRHRSVGPTGAQFRWGPASMAELASAHPRLALLREQSVSECYGWPGMALETLWRPWLGAPLYGMATLGVEDEEKEQAQKNGANAAPGAAASRTLRASPTSRTSRTSRTSASSAPRQAPAVPGAPRLGRAQSDAPR